MSKSCDQCGSNLKPNRRRFCSNKCKDRYHNLNNPRGKFAHLAGEPLPDIDEDAENCGHIFSSGYYGHGQE